MTIRQQQLTTLDKYQGKPLRILFITNLAFLPGSFELGYFLSSGRIVGSNFSRLFFRPSGNVSAKAVAKSSS